VVGEFSLYCSELDVPDVDAAVVGAAAEVSVVVEES